MLAPILPPVDELRLIDLSEVRRLTCLSRSHIYSLLQRDEFPSPTKIGRATRWPAHEVQAWIADQLQRRGS